MKLCFKKRKRRYLNNNSQLKQFHFSISNDFKSFYKILEKSKLQYGAKPTHSLKELMKLKKTFPEDVHLIISKHKKQCVGGSVVFFTNQNSSLVFYNTIEDKFRTTQLATLQLYRCMGLSKKHNRDILDLGVSHNPESKTPLSPKFSLIQFKELFGARGVLRIVYQKDYRVNKKN